MPTPPTPALELQLEREVGHLAEEFAGVFDAGAVREQVLEAAKQLPTSTLDGYRATFAGRYARELLNAMARASGQVPGQRPQILFVCLRDAGRSPMAAAFARSLSGGAVDVLSAGSAPAGEIHATVNEAMRELGIELTDAYPKPLSDHFVRAADAVVTMGNRAACPVFPGKRHEDWDVGDPAGAPIERVREIRDDIRRRVVSLLETLGTVSGQSRS
jgi:protein-tyrosine-phosphatase